MNKYWHSHANTDQISNYKHDIYFYGQLSTKVLAQAASKTTKFMFTQTGQLDKYGFGSGNPKTF